jgi:hypothetical protein
MKTIASTYSSWRIQRKARRKYTDKARLAIPTAVTAPGAVYNSAKTPMMELARGMKPWLKW